MLLLANLHVRPRPIWMSRHGESQFNTQVSVTMFKFVVRDTGLTYVRFAEPHRGRLSLESAG